MKNNKIISLKILKKKISILKKKRKSIILCHGCFDILHFGHAIHFNQAKRKGDILVVSITKDKFIKKGKNRPIFNYRERAYLLSQLSSINFVTINNLSTSEDVIEIIKPDFYIKGKDYALKKNKYNKNFDNEKNLVIKNGGKVLFTRGKSSSSTLAVKKLYEKV